MMQKTTMMIANYKKVRFCPIDNPLLLNQKEEQPGAQHDAVKQSSCAENLIERRYVCSK